jgi:ADP-ribose pyrophosphatase
MLVLQYRYLKEKQSIEFPAGGIGIAESPLDGAKQELLEETGCTADDWYSVGTFEPANGLLRDTTHVFVAHVVGQGDQQLDDTEDIEILYRRPDEIEDMVRRGDIWDGQTLATWAMVRHRFLEKGVEQE